MNALIIHLSLLIIALIGQLFNCRQKDDDQEN